MTLVELLIALALMAFSVGLAGIAYNNASPRFALKSASTQLVSDLKAARLHAKQTGDAVAVTPRANGYDVAVLNIERHFHKAVKAHWTFDSEVLVFSRTFTHLGGEVQLSVGARQATIRVHPITGMIERLE